MSHPQRSTANDTISGLGFGYQQTDLDAWNGTGTNDTGYYRFRAVAGNITISVRWPGYRMWFHQFFASENETRLVNIRLDPLPPETATIQGRVIDEENKTISQADMHVYHLDHDYHNWTQADGDGFYVFHVAPGNVSLDAGGDGFQHYGTTLFLGNGQVLEHNITLARQGEPNALLYGWVNDTNGTPVENARVSVHHYGMDWGNETTTDEHGYYMLGTFEGWSRVAAYRNGFFRVEEDIEVRQGDNRRDFILEPLPPMNSTMYGRVRDDSTGDPLPGGDSGEGAGGAGDESLGDGTFESAPEDSDSRSADRGDENDDEDEEMFSPAVILLIVAIVGGILVGAAYAAKRRK